MTEATRDQSRPNPLSIHDLESRINGEVITPTDDIYDEARSTYYNIDKRPAVIVRPVDASNVATVVTRARETGTELAVRSGGHNLAGHSVTEGGILLNLSEMKDLAIDLEDRTAWAGSGLTAGEYTVAVGEHGLATGFGDTGSVGVGGITLGGGIGLLVRKYGLTIDSLLAAEIVTADGQILEVNEESHPDLFWAIRGGGGNFGVVTHFKFRLHEVPSIVGGFLVLPPAPEVIEGFVGASQAAPEELSTIGNVMKAPPMPFLPPEHHGKPVLFAILTYAGDTKTGEEVISRFRQLAEPIVDMTGPKTYPEMFPPEGGPEMDPAAEFHSHNLFADSIDLADARHIVSEIEASDSAMAAVQLRVLGGAMARVPADATAFAHRDRAIMVNVAAVSTGSEGSGAASAWAGNLADTLADGDAAYVNFIGDDSPEAVGAAYPQPTRDRLVEIKGKYDPGNLFRNNYNIPPG
ncbi:MAG: FAD-binding protein [Acidimicrobiia bacterium]|nr:FAD-binding protein [Acidimicrobiia bacterium]